MNKGVQKDSMFGIGAILLLMIWSIALFLFALMSGAEASDGTVAGIVANAPNALLWLTPIVLIYVTWKRQIIGGLLFFLFGVATILLFSTHQSIVALLAISTPALVLGALLMTQTMWDKSLELAEDLPL
jgi:hypothetical protein